MSVRKSGAQNRVGVKNTEGPAHGMHLLLDPGDQNGNKVSCNGNKSSSPDSLRSISSLSSSSRDSPADVEMLDCCLSKEAPAEDVTVGNVLANQPFIPTPFHDLHHCSDERTLSLQSSEDATSIYLDTKTDNWNESMDLVITNLQECRDTLGRCSIAGSDRSSDTSPDCAMTEGSEGHPDPSPRGSCDDGRDSTVSLSSGEMVMRKNSFSLDESESEKLLSVSLVGDTHSPSSVPSEKGTLSIVLPDVCEGLEEKQHTGVADEDDMDSQHNRLQFSFQCTRVLAAEESLLSLPCEMQEESPPSVASTDPFCVPIECESTGPGPLGKTYIEVEPLQCSSEMCTPIHGTTVLLLGSEESDTSGNAQTSTPVQGLQNKTFSIPSLTESPYQHDRGDLGSPALRAVKRQPGTPISTTTAVSRTPVSTPNKHTRMDVKKFPQPDFKNIKPKVTSRTATPLKVPNSGRVMSTPGKSSLANQGTSVNTPRPAHRKTEAVTGDGNKRRSSSNLLKGVAPKPGSRRVSECDPTLPLKTPRDAMVSSPQRQTAVSDIGSTPGSSSINNTTFVAVPAPSDKNCQNKTVKVDAVQGGKYRAPKEDSTGKVTTVELNAENQEGHSVSVSSKLAVAGAPSDGSRGRLGQRPSPGRAKSASSSQTPTANLRLPPPVAKLKLGTSSKDGRTSGSMSASRTKNIPTPGNQKMRLTERPSVAAVIVTVTKPALATGLAVTHTAAGSKLPVKAQDQGEGAKPSPLPSIQSQPGAGNAGARGSAPAVCKPDSKPARPGPPGGLAPRLLGKSPITKAMGVRNRVQSPQGKGMTAGTKNAALPSQTPSKSAPGPLRRTGSARFQRPATGPPVDKNKQKPSPRTQPQPQPNGQPDLLPPTEGKPLLGAEHYRAQCDKNNQCIQQLKKLLASGNRRFEAVTVVIQHILTEREEALKQRQELSQELVTLRGELVTSTTSCENLEREKDELRVAFEGVLQKVQEQHQSDLADLEERLKTFYSAEWEKVHQAYQEEADKCKNQMQQQVDDLKSKHEALRKELEASHAEKLDDLKREYETTFEELRKTHQQEMETLDNTLKEAEAKLTEQIQDLTTENNALNEKLKAEEDRRRMLAEKNQKDSHTLYLEQELESLKVVLEIKNKQLHQQDKKLMQMDKLLEKNVKLDECLKKVQQENEDLKARMDKHAALSRQLSTEQAVLQESLQKESKVNKRLSMENEELLWKLHNGDLSSPRKLSPTSPSKSFQSPRNSGVFSSTPISPR